MQKDLFKNYFKSVANANLPSSAHAPSQMNQELSEFFRVIFNINVDQDDLDEILFPTFEEALGILDLAELRRESLRLFDLEDVGARGNRIRLIRQFLIMAMAKAIADNLHKVKGHHLRLVNKLLAKKIHTKTIFVSTNYDILIDNALLHIQASEIPGKMLDYSVDFTNFGLPANTPQRWRIWHKPKPSAVRLFKLHGSLNWLYCSTCNSLTLTPGMKGAIRLIERTREDIAKCQVCNTFMSPVIVPPTFYKDMSRVFLSLVWNKAENALREVDHIIFCGYSFPDADIHIKYLLKRVQTNRPADQPLRFTVINSHAGKKPEQAEEEEERFKRFLGRSVNYTQSSFDEFASDPKAFYA